MIDRPPVRRFLEDLAAFLGMDVVRLTNRCRDALLAALMGLRRVRGGSALVVDSNAHYSTYLAAEALGLEVIEVPNTGYPEFKVKLEAYKDALEAAEERTGQPALAALLTHADPYYGNLNDARAVAEICREHGVPFILNAAYTAGVMPLNGRELGADVLVSSGQKSWSSSGPLGILAMTEEIAEQVLVRSALFPNKELYLLGCPALGVGLATLMASFPHVVERVTHWPEEVEKARWLAGQLERIEGVRQLGVRPKEHHVICFETPGFHEIAKKHKRKGFFLYEELKARGIVGIQPGLTRRVKLSTYGLTREELARVAEAFHKVAAKYGLDVR